MSTYVLMRILESAPRRYELGINLLTLGRLGRVYDRLVQHIEPGQRVLDLGTGAGALALRAARRGAKVKGIDINPQMLEIARQRVEHAGLAESVDLVEMGVAELDREAAQSFDAVLSGLCCSELSEDELDYTLEQALRILKPGGALLIADEVRPRTVAGRVVYALSRAPLIAITWLLTQQTTHPLARLPERLAEAGFAVLSVRQSSLPGMSEIVARKPAS